MWVRFPPAALAFAVALLVLAGAASSAARARPGSIVFARGEGSGPTGLFAIAADGSHLRRLTGEFAESPAWSPDGRRIVYRTPYGDADSYGLHVLVPGGRPRLLAPSAPQTRVCQAMTCTYDDPAWSPDGRLIACTFHTETEDFETNAIAVVPAGGGRARLLTGPAEADEIQEPAWSPRSDALAFAADDGIRVVGAHGGPSRLVARGYVHQPAWSRTGRIAFAATNRIEVVNPDGSGRRVVARVAGATKPVWSPSGRLLVFETVRNEGPGPLFVVGADGSKLRLLAPVGAEPSWSPDGSLIVYAVEGIGAGPLFVVAPDGTHRRQLTRSGSDSGPAWQPR